MNAIKWIFKGVFGIIWGVGYGAFVMSLIFWDTLRGKPSWDYTDYSAK